MRRIRRAYLWVWREEDDGTYGPLIIANLKFATFNLAIVVVLLCTRLVLEIM